MKLKETIDLISSIIFLLIIAIYMFSDHSNNHAIRKKFCTDHGYVSEMHQPSSYVCFNGTQGFDTPYRNLTFRNITMLPNRTVIWSENDTNLNQLEPDPPIFRY